MTKHIYLNHKNGFSLHFCFLFLFSGFVLSTIIASPHKVSAQDARADEKWLGSYTFDTTARSPKRRKLTDVAPSASYDINIEQNLNGKLKATFNANGVQLFEAYQCSVKTDGKRIEIYYEKFVADGAKDLRKFKKGELLFSLTEIRSGRQTKYLFQPAAYKITHFDKSKQNQPVYFIKQQ